ncbi:hypothetical protein SNE40_019935 [Patella caerulea]|uniref:NADH dehydrogenase [ubiquinone] 1 beta subcomplex subunit 2, mitochondrial n=1 Tax=Patella caerulea TaxID=87958 RepID=A0AAN8G6K0_PATCE
MFGLSRLRTVSRVLKPVKNVPKTQVCHASTWCYRKRTVIDNKSNIYCDFIGVFLWYWILYGLYREPEHIIGHYVLPDTSKWTDEELGIPPDEEG